MAILGLPSKVPALDLRESPEPPVAANAPPAPARSQGPRDAARTCTSCSPSAGVGSGTSDSSRPSIPANEFSTSARTRGSLETRRCGPESPAGRTFDERVLVRKAPLRESVDAQPHTSVDPGEDVVGPVAGGRHHVGRLLADRPAAQRGDVNPDAIRFTAARLLSEQAWPRERQPSRKGPLEAAPLERQERRWPWDGLTSPLPLRCGRMAGVTAVLRPVAVAAPHGAHLVACPGWPKSDGLSHLRPDAGSAA